MFLHCRNVSIATHDGHGQASDPPVTTKAPLSGGAWEDPSPGSWDVLIGLFEVLTLDQIGPKKTQSVKYHEIF